MIDQKLLRKYTNAFIMFEIANHGVDPRETLEGTTMRIGKNEGYKYNDIENWKKRLEQPGRYVDKVTDASSETNLMDYHQENFIKDKLSDEQEEALEAALQLLYTGNNDPVAFGQIVKTVGKSFDVLGFMFFLKDPEIYMPVRSQRFDDRFKLLSVDSQLTGNCSWEKYQQYNDWVREVQAFLQQNLNPVVTMIDAHSFLWVLPWLESYLDNQLQAVEHKSFGKGIVIGLETDGILVRFGKDIKKIGKDAAFKGMLKFIPTGTDIYGRKIQIRPVDDEMKQLNETEDDKLVADVGNAAVETSKFEYTGGKKDRPIASMVRGHPAYPRSRQVACNALAHAQYKCEIDPSHPTFLRKSSGKPYTEPHHLIPMSYQDQIEFSIDREENVVSLCSNCHNAIHYGQDAKKLVERLFADRNNHLKEIGVEVTLDQVLEMYD